MTTLAPAEAPALTVGVFLLGQRHGAASVEGLRSALRDRGVADLATQGLGRVSTAGRDAVQRHLASAVAGLLEIDLADLVVGGWRTHTALTGASRRTWAAPGAVEVVDLLAHTVTASYEPYVDVNVETVTVARVEVALTVVFTVTGLAATVRDGALVGLTGGRCVTEARLAVHGVPMLQRTQTFVPDVLVPLRRGIWLLRPGEGSRWTGGVGGSPTGGTPESRLG